MMLRGSGNLAFAESIRADYSAVDELAAAALRGRWSGSIHRSVTSWSGKISRSVIESFTASPSLL